jgi:hypothetical protein
MKKRSYSSCISCAHDNHWEKMWSSNFVGIPCGANGTQIFQKPWEFSKIEALSTIELMLEVWKKRILPLSLSLNHNTRTQGLPTILMHYMCKCICIWLCLHPKLLIQDSRFGICALILEFATLCYIFLSQSCNLLWLSINWKN